MANGSSLQTSGEECGAFQKTSRCVTFTKARGEARDTSIHDGFGQCNVPLGSSKKS